MLKKQLILGVGITVAPTAAILENILMLLSEGQKKFFIVTPNPEILVYAQSHLDYKDRLNSAEVSLADGVGVLIASKILGLGITERTTGVDFIEELCKASREKPLSIGFLGGRGGVAEKTAECLKQKYPWINVVFTGETWLDQGVKSKKKMDMLFVAYGFPKQENWIVENLDRLPVTAAMGVGGAFDYISGSVPRAPKIMRVVGLEWFFRLIVQPWRLRRQLALVTFLQLTLKEKFSSR